MKIIDKIIGDPSERALKKIQPLADEINELESELEKLSEGDLKEKTAGFRARLEKGETTDDILPEAFAVVREIAKRTLGQRHYDVQMLGGIVLHQGRIAEMKTGEGKTLSSTTALYLNALEGLGVHVVTVNDYLARRDTVWMGQIYDALGLTVGCITNRQAYVYDPEYKVEDKEELEEADETRDELGAFRVEESFLRPVERKEAYAADITYGTNNEFGFDYLRDNLAQSVDKKVQRGHHFAIIDEIDSALIDEARTPLIISAPDDTATDLYTTFARIVPEFKEDVDYNVDYKLKTVSITEEGIDKIENKLGIENIYDPSSGGGIRYVHQLEQALKANVIFQKDKDYVVREGEVIIVDEFTGRLMPGRRYSEGLHQAIEAKEGVAIKQESRTLASITFQNFFRMYEKLAGMTGTAKTSEEEFTRVYNLEVVEIPTNKPLIRKELPDMIFKSYEGKYTALMREIKERHASGQPILIGTTSIEKNEHLGALLKREGIKHEVLNAKNHEKEGEIIAQAGREGAVTVATNMAGRGVDIILGGNPPDPEKAKKVREAGGLHVVGTERHEARRIDDQLRGRAGRQGDPGSSQFYLSLEDDLMRVVGGEKISGIMERFNVPEDQPLESKIVTNSIESAQKRIEGMNFDARKRVLDYDEVLNKHRETIYKKRNDILEASDEEIKETIREYINSYFNGVFEHHLAGPHPETWNIEEIFEEMRSVAGFDDTVHSELENIRKEKADKEVVREKLKDFILRKIVENYEAREEKLGAENLRRAERWLILRNIDILWMDHLDAMDYMRQDVRLRAYAQLDPLVEYKNEGLKMFRQLEGAIESQVVHSLFKIQHSHNHTHSHDHASHKVAQNIITSGAQKQQGASNNKQAASSNKPKEAKNIGRNDPCYCGSGKKYKKCHGKE